jgi:Carboxypeptidase regulatory-like domain/TonB dependent receptor/TonB-dependent Receptor Plug Domain
VSLRKLIFLSSLLLFSSYPVLAQVDTGSIVGAVADASGASVAAASVTIEEETTGQKETQQSGNDGSYSFSPLKIGSYTLTVEKPGFKTSIQKHIQVTVQGHLAINPKLQVGEVDESVQVTSTGPILETQTSSIQQLIDQRAINDLPLNGRNATFLAQLSPGVTIAQNDSRGLQASGSFTANGSRRTQNDYLLDGMDDNVAVADLVNQSQFAVLPPPDALREFTVQTNNYSAEFGHSAGAVLNVTTKSGSNALHGDLWEFLRNDYFDAKDYFVLSSQRKPEFRQNQFGGTVGGPVVIPHFYNGHDKTFFFVDYQGTRIVQGKTYTETVPTAAETSSGFTNLQDLIALQSGTRTDLLGRQFPSGTVFDPATTRTITAGHLDPTSGLTPMASGYARDPFYAGPLFGATNFTGAASKALLNQLPAGRLNSGAIALLKLYPAPTSGALTNNYTTSPSATTNINSFDTRFDEVFSEKDSAFVRYSYVYNNQFQPSPFLGVADGGPSRPGTGWTESQNTAFSETHIFTPRLVLEARIGYSRVADERRQNDANVLGIPAQYGIPGIPQVPSNGGLPSLGFGQLASIGSAGTLPSDKASDIFQVSENLSIDRGRNQVRLGTEFQHIAAPTLTPTTSRGSFSNSGVFTSVVNSTDNSTDRAQFILNPESSTVANGINNVGGSNSVSASNFPSSFHLVRPYFGAYVQDNWRALQHLTLNLGLRYEFIGAPEESNGRFADFVPAQTGTTSDGISRFYIPASQVANEPVAFQNLLAKDGIVFTPVNGNSLVLAQKTNFAPRLGLAYQVTPKLAVRGGYGLFFQGNENHGLSISNYINFPFQVTSSYSAGNAVTPITSDNSVGALQNGLLNVPLTPATAAASSSTSLTLLGEPRNAKSSYSQAYNLQLQYQVTPNTIAEAAYVGTGARHVQVQIGSDTVNSILPPSASVKTNQFFPDFATGGTFIARAGQTNYNSLQANLEHRFSANFSLLANFTWSKCLGDSRDLLDNGIGSYRAPYVPGLGINADYGLCDIDVRRIVHVSGTYQLPFGKSQRWLNQGPASWIAGGWSTNWIFTAQDGQPLTIACSTTNAAGLGCNALKVPGQNPYAGSHNAAQFLNPAAFANPPAATATSASPANLGGSPTQVTGPPYRRLNLSVFRRFTAMRETFFEFRAEAFNLTNTPNFGQPGSLTFTTPNTFASISSTRDNPNDPREIQLSLKYYF